MKIIEKSRLKQVKFAINIELTTFRSSVSIFQHQFSLKKATMNIRLSLQCLLLVFWIGYAQANCCKPRRFIFEHDGFPNMDCDNFDAESAYDPNNKKLCLMSACGDGSNPAIHYPENPYCGVGWCNPFGCNCDRGCIPGDPWESYKNRHQLVKFVRYLDEWNHRQMDSHSYVREI